MVTMQHQPFLFLGSIASFNGQVTPHVLRDLVLLVLEVIALRALNLLLS